MIAALLGFFAPYIPDVGKAIWGWLKGKSDAKDELARMRLMDELEDKRAAREAEGKRQDRETQLALVNLQGEIAGGLAELKDRQAARKYGTRTLSLVVQTLKLGHEMELPRWVQSVGFFMAIGVETFAASVQPMIAATVFTAWAYHKWQTGLTWGASEYDILWSVVAFYLSNRVKKTAALGDGRRAATGG